MTKPITLHLLSAAHLFEEQPFDQCEDPDVLPEAGIDTLLRNMKIARFAKEDELDLTIKLKHPADKAKLHKSLTTYCEKNILMNRSEKKAMKITGRRYTRKSLFFALLVLLIAFILHFMLSIIDSGLDDIVAGIAVIIIWMIIWAPTEMWFYDWWPLEEDAKLYEKIMKANIKIE